MVVTPDRQPLEVHRTDADPAIALLAEQQLGVVTRGQCAALGATDAALETRLRTGRLIPVAKHVLRIAGAPSTPLQRLLIAVLDAGPGAVATLRPAAAVWDLPGFGLDPPDVLVTIGSNHRPSVGTLRETRSLPSHHVTVRRSIPVVTPARLVVELAGREHPGRVERTVDAALAASVLTPAALASAVSELAGRGRRGSRLLRELVEHLSPGYVPPASELESRFLQLLRRAGLPEPDRQLDAGGEAWVGRVDFAYPGVRLLIELDSRRWHGSAQALESDRTRDNRLVLAGWRVIRITWRQLHDDPVGVIALLRGLLAPAVAA